MKSGDMSKTTAIAIACLSLAMYAIAQEGASPPAGLPGQSTSEQPQNQSLQPQDNLSSSIQTSSLYNNH